MNSKTNLSVTKINTDACSNIFNSLPLNPEFKRP